MASKRPIVLDSFGAKQLMQNGDYLDITYGGTGATTAAGARTSLGVVIGTNVQAWSAQLDALAALASAGTLVRTGANTFVVRALQAPAAGITVSNGDGVNGNPTLFLANDLAAVEGLAGTGFAVRTAADTWAQRQIAVASTARLTVSNPDGVAGNPTLDLAALADGGGGTLLKFTRDTYGRVSGTSAVATGDLTALLNTTYLGLGGGTLTGPLTLAADPTQPLHAATKNYVDTVSQGMTPKPTATVATAGALPTNTYVNGASGNGATITINATGVLAVDGYNVALNDTVLVKDEATAQYKNGLYVCTTAGAVGVQAVLTRAVGMDVAAEFNGAFIPVSNIGAANKNSLWLANPGNGVVVGTTAIPFTQVNGATDIIPGNAITINANTIAVNYTARFTLNAGALDLASGVVGGSGVGTFTKFTVDTYGRITSTATATPADIGAQPSSAELTALAGLATTGLVARTAAGTYVPRSLIAPAAGITVTYGDGVASNPTLSLANDLAAVEGLAGTGIAVRTAADTWAQRQVAVASTARLVVTNPAGVAGDITLDLAAGVIAVPGTFNSVTVDTYGRVTAGSNNASASPAQSTLTNNEAGTSAAGSTVYTDATGTFRKANGNAAGTSLPIGILPADIGAASAGLVTTSGEVSLTTAQWDAVTGQTGGLSPGAVYFLDVTTAGKITSTVPATGYLVVVGQALSTTKMVVRIGDRIQL